MPTDMEKVLALVPLAQVTRTAAQNGLWSDSATWGGITPQTNDFVRIPHGISVVQDVTTPRLTKLFIQGELSPLQSACVTLNVETAVSDMDSRVFAGSATEEFDGQWDIKFLDYGPIDLVKDPWAMSRGFHFMGRVELNGKEITPKVFTTGNIAGSKVVNLYYPCVGWKVGDKVVLPGTGLAVLDDDEGVIASISEDRMSVTLVNPLVFNHTIVDSEGFYRPMFIANISKRHVHFTSENLTVARRGHVMVMSNGNMMGMDDPTLPLDSEGMPTKWIMHYVSSVGCGRTDKSKDVTDPDGLGNGLANPRGRYAIHFHRCSPDITGMMADVYGCFIQDTPGWGIVNHDSYVCADNCLGYKYFGAAFVGEIGTETGCFCDCVAVRTSYPVTTKFNIGLIDDNVAINNNNDWGKFGQGVATMCGAIEITGCIVTGTYGPAYVLVGQPFNHNKPTPVVFATKNLPAPYTYFQPTIQARHVPQRLTNLNWFGCTMGINPWRISQEGPSLIANNYIKNCKGESGVVIALSYATNLDIEDVTVVRIAQTPSMAVSRTASPMNIYFRRCKFYGFLEGCGSMMGGAGLVEDCHFKAGIGVHIAAMGSVNEPVRPRIIRVNNVTLDPLPNTPKDRVQLTADVGFTSNDMPKWINYTATGNQISEDQFFLDGQYLYMVEEGPNFRLSNCPAVPDFLKILTNKQMWDQYGIVIGAKLVPSTATQPSDVEGLVSDIPAIKLPALTVAKSGDTSNYQLTNQKTGFILKVKNAAGSFVQSGPHNLNDKSWNVCRVQADGYNRGVFVYCDSASTPPASW